MEEQNIWWTKMKNYGTLISYMNENFRWVKYPCSIEHLSLFSPSYPLRQLHRCNAQSHTYTQLRFTRVSYVSTKHTYVLRWLKLLYSLDSVECIVHRSSFEYDVWWQEYLSAEKREYKLKLQIFMTFFIALWAHIAIQCSMLVYEYTMSTYKTVSA